MIRWVFRSTENGSAQVGGLLSAGDPVIRRDPRIDMCGRLIERERLDRATASRVKLSSSSSRITGSLGERARQTWALPFRGRWNTVGTPDHQPGADPLSSPTLRGVGEGAGSAVPVVGFDVEVRS